MSPNGGLLIKLNLRGEQKSDGRSVEEKISCVIEKIAKKESITDSEKFYGSLSQRVPVFHKTSVQNYVIYQPFFVINATKHTIKFFNTDREPLKAKKGGLAELAPNQSKYVDFNELKKTKMRIKVDGYSFSDVKDFFTAGVHGVVDLKPERRHSDL
jgi:hypothetical protein